MADELERDFQGAISALQARLGDVVFLTVGNYDANEPAVAGFAGVLGYAERPDDPQIRLLQAEEDDRIFTFFVGADRPFDRSWFTLDERTFRSCSQRLSPEGLDIVDRITVRSRGVTLVVNVPTRAALEASGYEPRG
jgi:hypothetical protein